MRVAFYAPLKAPDHPVPSGDRRIAQLLTRALGLAGHRVEVVSRLRSYNRDGDAATQRRIDSKAARVADRIIAQAADAMPDLWFTYHCYHKAPDLLGPVVAQTLGIPYVIADASIAPKRARGPWADGYAAAERAIRHADRLIAFDPIDVPMLRATRPDTEIVTLPPLADIAVNRTTESRAEEKAMLRRALAGRLELDPNVPWLTSVAMMRPGAKLDSYNVLAQALGRIADRPWSLLIAGDGPARADVEAAFDRHLNIRKRIRFLGQLDSDAIDRLHRATDLAVWPGVDEGYCMALVEAQVAGLAAVAGNRPGIATVVADGETGLLTPVGDAAAFAEAVGILLEDDARRKAMGERAESMALRFDLESAARRLDAVLEDARIHRVAA